VLREPEPRPSFAFRAVMSVTGSVYVEISGDLDITTRLVLANRLASLAELRPAELFIDLSGVSLLDCASARLLASTAALLPADRHPVLTSVRPMARRVLELTGLAALIEIAAPGNTPEPRV
jgi:anti-anti-sigma factor